MKKKYRMLKAGEYRRYGDQVFREVRGRKKWINISITNGLIMLAYEVGLYRRPIRTPAGKGRK
jgi:hypothetical protein